MGQRVDAFIRGPVRLGGRRSHLRLLHPGSVRLRKACRHSAATPSAQAERPPPRSPTDTRAGTTAGRLPFRAGRTRTATGIPTRAPLAPRPHRPAQRAPRGRTGPVRRRTHAGRRCGRYGRTGAARRRWRRVRRRRAVARTDTRPRRPPRRPWRGPRSRPPAWPRTSAERGSGPPIATGAWPSPSECHADLRRLGRPEVGVDVGAGDDFHSLIEGSSRLAGGLSHIGLTDTWGVHLEEGLSLAANTKPYSESITRPGIDGGKFYIAIHYGHAISALTPEPVDNSQEVPPSRGGDVRHHDTSPRDVTNAHCRGSMCPSQLRLNLFQHGIKDRVRSLRRSLHIHASPPIHRTPNHE